VDKVCDIKKYLGVQLKKKQRVKVETTVLKIVWESINSVKQIRNISKLGWKLVVLPRGKKKQYWQTDALQYLHLFVSLQHATVHFISSDL
jgi:hypothetical protein